MQIVTVPGGMGVTIAIPFSSETNAAVADQLLAQLFDANPSSVHAVNASSGTIVDKSVPGDINEFIDDVSGQIALPSGYQYLISDYRTVPSAPYPDNSFIAAGTLDNAVIDAQSNAISYEAGTGAVSIVAGGNFTITTGLNAGGGEILGDGSGAETLTLGSGSWSISTGTGRASITLGTGNDTVVANGAATIRGGNGNAVVTLEQSGGEFIGGAGKTTLVDNGLSDTLRAGIGRETVFGQASGLHIFGAGAEVLFVETQSSHNNFLTAGAGGAVVFGGPHGSNYQTGGSYFFFTSGGGSDTINAPSGTVGPIVFGSPGGRVRIEGVAAGSFVVAGAGGETIDASALQAGAIFFAGTGSADLIGGAGSNFYAASTGNSTMSGGTGNVYEFINGHAGGIEVITNFGPYDSLYLAEYGTAPGSGIRTEIVTNGSLDLTLTDGTQIIFDNISNATQLSGHIHNI